MTDVDILVSSTGLLPLAVVSGLYVLAIGVAVGLDWVRELTAKPRRATPHWAPPSELTPYETAVLHPLGDRGFAAELIDLAARQIVTAEPPPNLGSRGSWRLTLQHPSCSLPDTTADVLELVFPPPRVPGDVAELPTEPSAGFRARLAVNRAVRQSLHARGLLRGPRAAAVAGAKVVTIVSLALGAAWVLFLANILLTQGIPQQLDGVLALLGLFLLGVSVPFTGHQRLRRHLLRPRPTPSGDEAIRRVDGLIAGLQHPDAAPSDTDWLRLLPYYVVFGHPASTVYRGTGGAVAGWARPASGPAANEAEFSASLEHFVAVAQKGGGTGSDGDTGDGNDARLLDARSTASRPGG